MAQVSEKEIDAMRRRVASVANHLISGRSIPDPKAYSLELCNNASTNNSYYRIHGAVRSHDVVWSVACDEFGTEFTDIIYEKAVGEAIAKVTYS